MIDLDALCGELNVLLPSSGWPLVYPLTAFPARHGNCRYAAAIWGDGTNGERSDEGSELGLQLYERDKKSVMIVFEARHCTGDADPDVETAEGILLALNEFRWVIAPKAEKVS